MHEWVLMLKLVAKTQVTQTLGEKQCQDYFKSKRRQKLSCWSNKAHIYFAEEKNSYRPNYFAFENVQMKPIPTYSFQDHDTRNLTLRIWTQTPSKTSQFSFSHKDLICNTLKHAKTKKNKNNNVCVRYTNTGIFYHLNFKSNEKILSYCNYQTRGSTINQILTLNLKFVVIQ